MKHLEDSFARDGLPAPDAMPWYGEPLLPLPETLNCTDRLLDEALRQGYGDRIAVRNATVSYTYRQLQEAACRIARVLTEDMGMISGNRVLLRSFNHPMMVACWFGILKAGGIVVASMPLLRARELQTLIECARIGFCLCDARLAGELEPISGEDLPVRLFFNGEDTEGSLESRMETKIPEFDTYPCFATEIALIGFTSGTTGKPKMTAHYHRDVLAVCESFPRYCLEPRPGDVFTGSPPIGFTFGLGGLVLFPLYYGASAFLIEKPSPEALLEAITEYGATVCFTAPTAWRHLTRLAGEKGTGKLRKCVSAGEALPAAVWQDWFDLTGLKLIDGIGATEMLHIFISAREEEMRKGFLGKPMPGYEARVMREDGSEAAEGETGRLAVRGITGCKYLYRPEKQAEYVKNGWNYTGDAFRRSGDGWFQYVSRADDMIISSGYNIAAVEVESVLLGHPEVLECAVTGEPDEERTMRICAHIVLRHPEKASGNLVREIQDWFKEVAAPYKYPREIRFRESLPKTPSGKIQHYLLRSPT